MSDDAPVPVTVVTGFLGAGKTTLVNHWLGDYAPGDVAVVVNEHGEVGVDGELLAERVRQLVEITGGCVCCATQSELVTALEVLATRAPRPRRILVETSGAASPAGLVRPILSGGRTGAYGLDGVVTVLDATRADAVMAHEVALEQLGYADVVVLSRADACTADEASRARARSAETNGAAIAVTAARGVVDSMTASSLEDLLSLRADLAPGPGVEGAREAPHDAERAAHVYESVSLTLDGEVDGERFADFVESELARFAGRIFRTKGILAVTGVDERLIVQGVADSVEVSFGAAWTDGVRTSRLVVVGFGLDRESLERAFLACSSDRPDER